MAMQFSEEDQEKLKNSKSAIYQKRSDKYGKEELAKLSGKKKWAQFRDYYLKGVIAVVVILCLIVGGIFHSFTNKKCSLYIAIRHDVIPEEKLPALADAIAKYMKFDMDKEMVTINTSCTDHQLQAYFYAGTADVLITDEEHFKKWGQAEYFCEPEANKEVSFYRAYDEKYRYYTSYVTGEDILENKETLTTETEAGDKTKYNCGLYLTDSEKYQQISGMIEKPVIGIATTSKHMPEAKKFVQYMMDNSQELSLEEE